MTIIHSNIYLYKLLNAVHVQPTLSKAWDCSKVEDRKKADLELQWQEVLEKLGNWKGLAPDGQWAAIMVYHPARHPTKHRGPIHYPLTAPQFMEKATQLFADNNNGYSPTYTAKHPFP